MATLHYQCETCLTMEYPLLTHRLPTPTRALPAMARTIAVCIRRRKPYPRSLCPSHHLAMTPFSTQAPVTQQGFGNKKNHSATCQLVEAD